MEIEQQLSVKDILQRPLFLEAKLVAGAGGMNRKVGWIHILELSTANPFTNKNDLVLTTGLGFHKYAEDRLTYLQKLIDQQATGLCIEMGPYFPAVPDDMTELANRNNFPIIIFENPVRFVDITQDIHALLINRQYNILKDLESFSRKLQQLTLESTNIQSILRLLHEHTSSQIFHFSLIEKHLFAPPLSPKQGQDLIAQYRAKLESNSSYSLESSNMSLNDGSVILSQPVICLGQTLSYVGIVLKDQLPSEYTILLLDHACKAVAHILLRKLFLEQKTSENHTQLINDILQQRVLKEEDALARIGLRPLSGGRYLFIAGTFEIEHKLMIDEDGEIEARNQDILVLLRSLLSKNGVYSLLLARNNQIYVLGVRESYAETVQPDVLKEPLKKLLEALEHSIQQKSWSNTRVLTGFGCVKTKLTEVYYSFKEASDALSISRTLAHKSVVHFYEELGIYRIFKEMSDERTLASFVEFHLGAVLEYDKENKSNLLKTLDHLLSSMGSKQETAEKLFIHRQTLYHRLEKLEELLGEDYLQPEKRICLEVAMRAHELSGNPA
ncbi:PucR family transcriptional regulator [Paenibacillus beijingensis]|uniref:PucR family transcriptional regulator n=1 Tax=Paenibacillus beijingensis TaxID=1126833 RepID=A0A0D5NFS9_9BACL|nr:PucR family transcriptional regulator [Paenibacillus beijingensis]AJY73763.1 hypothetical protein VN24_02855 [Paenibacillus beijingensis]